MALDQVINLFPGPTLVVTEDPDLATNLHIALSLKRLAPSNPVYSYIQALRYLTDVTPRLCVLDLDMRNMSSGARRSGEEARRLLAVLASRGCRTIAYTAHPFDFTNLTAIDPNVEIVSKSCPIEDVTARLERLAHRPKARAG